MLRPLVRFVRGMAAGACAVSALCLASVNAAPVWAEDTPAALPPLELRIDEKDVDLEAGRLVVRLSRPAARVTLKVIALSGAVLAEVDERFDAAPAGSPLTITWAPAQSSEDPIARIEVFGHDTSDYYKGVALTPWSFNIPHDDVVFETDSAEIRASEEKKLRATLALIKKELPRAKHLGNVSLFVVAHTDTVGSKEYNLALSRRRARALAQWFRSAGLKIPIAYEGMGEQALEVPTADEVPEARNRRADYMLGVEKPRFRKSGMMPDWKGL